MKLNSAVLNRSRRVLFLASVVICSIAVVLGGLVAVPAVPARADQSVKLPGFTVTYPGGDLRGTYDATGISPADASTYLTTMWPEGVGLSSGASLSALLRATWVKNESLEQSVSVPEPPSFTGGSITVASDGSGGTDISIDIPAAVIQANEGYVPDWAAAILGQAIGAVSSILTGALCAAGVIASGIAALVTTGAGGLVATALGAALCGGVGAATWTFMSYVSYQVLTGAPFDGQFWEKALLATGTAFLKGVLAGFLIPFLGALILKVGRYLYNEFPGFTAFIDNWFGQGTAFGNFISDLGIYITRSNRLIRSRMPVIQHELGNMSPRSSGEFTTAPTSPVGSVTPSCMDAYGASGGSAPLGQAVAVNSCNGNPNQDFEYYPNGMISVYGLCLAPGGGTSSAGTPLVTLEPCDGSADEQWTVSGQSLVNGGGGGCLDDPNQDTTPGTQLDLATCNGSQAQVWLPPTAEPCDIYAAYAAPCQAAYSMTRAMYAAYDGPLYQVRRASDGTTADIGVLAEGGDADAAAQDSFCAGTTCTVTEIYDQSPLGNNLTVEGGGGAAPAADRGAVATALPVTVGGHKAYGLDVEPGVGYRDDATLGIATNGEPEGMYMVASGTHVNSRCCFDFGNAEANNHDNGAAHMDAVNLSTTCYGGGQCSGSGPWVQADMENGLFMGSSFTNTANKGNATPFVTAMLGNDGQGSFQLNGGDSTSGGLSTWYNGALPAGYAPMQQEGAVLLGTGGDNSNWDVGSWFEGVMTTGDPSQAADDAVQANIVAAGYAGTTNPSGGSGAGGAAPSAAGPAVVHAAGATGAGSAGFSSVYTVDSANGHLQETYLPAMGDNWTSQDLSAKYGTPAVMPGTKPVAVVHCGYTSVYTVDAGSGDLQETYLPAIGDPWTTQDLSAKYGTPPTDATPTAVVHAAGATGSAAACGFTSVYTVDQGSDDLQETYLPVLGAPWTTQNLTARYGTPAVQEGTSPVAIVHCGFTSVYTVDQDHQLQETYLPAIGDPWTTQSLSAKYGTPDTTTTPTAVVHAAGATGSAAACGFTSVYTVDQGSDDLQETYLPVLGDPWTTQNLSAKYGTPTVAPGTAPTALVHMNYTSVYTVDEGSYHLQETFLPAIGDSWSTQDLSAKYATPPTDQTPIVLLHPDASGNLDWTSVYTTDQFNDHLQETYLPNTGFPGDSWVTQDLTAKYATPEADAEDTPTAGYSVVHSGYTSVYSVGPHGDLWETYLPAMGDAWTSQDLTAKGTPPVMNHTAPVVITHDGYTSVYTIDAGGNGVGAGDLQETFLPALGDSWSTQDLSAKYGTPAAMTTPAAVFHDGYTSVYTVDASNGDLWETYLPGAGFPGDAWHSQNLSTKGTPPVDAFTSPVAVFHDGYTSVYTIDAGTGAGAGDLQETYLPALGGNWITQNLSAKYGTPPANILTSPTAVVHNGYVSVYTVDVNGNNVTAGDLQETYLPAIGDSWSTQDLSVKYGTPQVTGGMPPAALTHTGYTSVVTVDAGSGDLQETYLPAIGDRWSTQNLTTDDSVPATEDMPAVLLHYDTSGGLTWTSIFSVDQGSADLQETYLPAIGDHWKTQNLTTDDGAPTV